MNSIRRILLSPRFFVGLIVLFIVEALWFAASARYPMASDEDFHFGIIQIYSHQWSPFFSHQPAGADMYGAIVRDPSYLYHYLLSFPLRLLRLVTSNQSVQVFGLRLLNIALATTSLVVFKKLLMLGKISTAITNLVLLLFICLPIWPYVAGQINYDNLFILCVAATFYLAYSVRQTIVTDHKLPAGRLGALLVLCLVASLVKYAFLPIFLAVVAYICWIAYRAFPRPRALAQEAQRAVRATRSFTRWILIIGLIAGSGLFAERYGYNLVKYHSPAPECDVVLNIASCHAYGPWERNYDFKTVYQSARKHWNIAIFSGHWIGNYGGSLIYTLNGPFSGYFVGQPLPVFRVFFWGFITFGVVAGSIFCRSIWRDYPLLRLCIIVTGLYMAVLWLQNYSDFKETGQAVAQQGRYLLPIIVPIFTWMLLGIQLSLRAMPQKIQLGIVGLVVFCLLQGSGVLVFICRSDNGWYWQNNHPVQAVNAAARAVIKPLIIGA